MKKTAILAAIILFCSVIAYGRISEPAQSATEGAESLLVYCGAGMKKPMDEVGSQFEQEYGVRQLPINNLPECRLDGDIPLW